jgi:hypothetical protein
MDRDKPFSGSILDSQITGPLVRNANEPTPPILAIGIGIGLLRDILRTKLP